MTSSQNIWILFGSNLISSIKLSKYWGRRKMQSTREWNLKRACLDTYTTLLMRRQKIISIFLVVGFLSFSIFLFHIFVWMLQVGLLFLNLFRICRCVYHQRFPYLLFNSWIQLLFWPEFQVGPVFWSFAKCWLEKSINTK